MPARKKFILYKANIFIWTTFGNNLPFCNVNGFKKNQLEKVKSCKKWPGGKKVAEWEKEETKVCSGNKEALCWTTKLKRFFGVNSSAKKGRGAPKRRILFGRMSRNSPFLTVSPMVNISWKITPETKNQVFSDEMSTNTS